ncbi:transcription repressor NadR [Clostridiaceae bacterium M8S5]|nr:transcription repressor NadR [Clostridiaceae bacterium M8S5]
MQSNERRSKIIKKLRATDKPLKGIQLAKEFDVSRQIIVQDIAILRAKGEQIIATPQGYINGVGESRFLKKKIVSKHFGYDEMRDELNIIIDNGGKVINVIVEHAVYGEIESPLMISSRLDIKNFMNNLKESNAEPLSSLTDGIHIHTIEVPDEDVYSEIKNELKNKKYLIDSM